MYWAVIIILNIIVIAITLILNRKYRKKSLTKYYISLFFVGFVAAFLAVLLNVLGETVLLTLFFGSIENVQETLYWN